MVASVDLLHLHLCVHIAVVQEVDVGILHLWVAKTMIGYNLYILKNTTTKSEFLNHLYYYKNQGSVCVCVFVCLCVCHVYAGHLPIDGSASYFTQS